MVRVRAGDLPQGGSAQPPLHSHCYYLTASRIDLIHLKPKFNPKAEQAFLASLPKNEVRDVVGSFEKRRRILEDKQTLETIYNEGKDELYRWKRAGDLAQTTAMPKVHPDVLRSGDAATIQAAEALVKAITTPEWGTKRFKAGNKTRQTLSDFAPFAHIPEIQDLIEKITRREPVDGFVFHYLKRVYVEREALSDPDDLNRWFEQTLNDPQAVLIQPKSAASRYLVYSDHHQMLAVLERNGERVSVHKHNGKALRDVWKIIANLIL